MHGRPHANDLAYFQNGPTMWSIPSPTIRVCSCLRTGDVRAMLTHRIPVWPLSRLPGPCGGADTSMTTTCRVSQTSELRKSNRLPTED
eukprot:1896222-Pyramimonas_sp.AAC.1